MQHCDPQRCSSVKVTLSHLVPLQQTSTLVNFSFGPVYITDSSNPLAQRLHLRRLVAALGIIVILGLAMYRVYHRLLVFLV